MNSKDKGVLISLGFVASMVLISIVAYKGSKYLSLMSICIIWVGIQQLYTIPIFVYRYLKVNEVKGSWLCWIPLWNEVSIMEPSYAKGYLTTNILMLVGACVAIAKPSFIGDIFGPKYGLAVPNWAIIFTMFMIMIACAIRGFAYIKIIRNINLMVEQYLHLKGRAEYKLVTFLQYVVLFLPLFRMLGIAYQLDKLNKLARVGDYHVGDEDNEYFEEPSVKEQKTGTTTRRRRTR